MPTNPKTLDADEVLGLALRATRRGDSVRAMEYARRALELAPGSTQAWVLLAGNLAGTGDMKGAEEAYARARHPAGIARCPFSARPAAVVSRPRRTGRGTWMPLEALGGEHPLFLFQRGLRHLIRDEFAPCIADLRAGIARNQESAALNRDMQKVIDRAQQALDAGA